MFRTYLYIQCMMGWHKVFIVSTSYWVVWAWRHTNIYTLWLKSIITTDKYYMKHKEEAESIINATNFEA